MNNYLNTTKIVESYLSTKNIDISNHIYEGNYRFVMNNWFIGCESCVEISVNKRNCTFSYKMYYNIKAVTRGERRNLSEYFTMANKRSDYICFAGINDDGQTYVEVRLDFESFPLTSLEQLQRFEKICSSRIAGDRIVVEEIR